MPLFLAGQVPTADELNALVTYKITLGTTASVTSSTTIVDTDIVVPITDLTEVRLDVRYTSLAGGIRWAWSATGTATCLSRTIWSAGDSTTSGTGAAEIEGMRWRTIATLTEEQTTAHINTSTSHMLYERLICEGSGVITFRFAQQTSNASATSVDAQSFATYQLIENG